ncbi:MAG: DUF5050 domain-containing protein [Clostridiales bacterium]|jgi:hypothetical protein|nr:DUF5050 domain-containing protein [Clostridiales bacterium]
MRKTILLSFGLILILVFTIANMAWGATTYKLYLGDKEIKFDVAPYEVYNRLLAPVRTISEATGAKVSWDSKTNAATIYRGADKLVLTVGSTKALYNDIEIAIDVEDVAPILKNSRIFLPLRFICEWLGLQVNYEGGTIRMLTLPSLPQPDTTTALKSNSNGNYQNEGVMIIWQNRMYNIKPASNSIISTDLTTGEVKELKKIGAQGQGNFQIWQDKLYLNYQTGRLVNMFAQIDAEGNIEREVAENARACQIHNGWLYYISTEGTPHLCRCPLAGGETQKLGVYYPQFVVTDQHIYAYDGQDYVLLRLNLDGSSRRRLLTAPNIRLKGLEYANGVLYFINYDQQSKNRPICQINTDGAGLKVFRQDGAEHLNISGDWLYYTSFTIPDDDNGRPFWPPKALCRVKLDGSGAQTLAETKEPYRALSPPFVMPDGSIYYYEQDNIWIKLDI